MLDLSQVTRADFAPLLGANFDIVENGQRFNLKLVEVANAGEGRPGAREPFALRFHGDPGLRVQQRIYRLETESLGELELFLVQIGADATASHLEAIFS